jgi:hypothetical protein
MFTCSAGSGDVALAAAVRQNASAVFLLALKGRPRRMQSRVREFDELLTSSAGRAHHHLHHGSLAIPICARISIGRMLRAGRGTFV